MLADLGSDLAEVEANIDRIIVEMTVMDGAKLAKLADEHGAVVANIDRITEQYAQATDRRTVVAEKHVLAAEWHYILVGLQQELAGAYACCRNARQTGPHCPFIHLIQSFQRSREVRSSRGAHNPQVGGSNPSSRYLHSILGSFSSSTTLGIFFISSSKWSNQDIPNSLRSMMSITMNGKFASL